MKFLIAQAAPTDDINKMSIVLIDYLATYLDAKICYAKSKRIVHFDSNVAYLVAPKARSRIVEYFYCGGKCTQ